MNKWKIVLPIILVGAGALALYMFIKFKEVPPRREVPFKGPLVSVLVVHTENKPIMIEGYGTVQPEHILELIPQVSGRVTELSENFVNGGFVKKGAVLVQIERDDYEIALTRARANLLNKEVAYKRALKQAHIAKKEWEEILENVLTDKKVVPDELTLYIPQLEAAKAASDAAAADVRLAELNLKRTTLKAPYDARILSRTTDIGQFVTPGKPLGRLFSIGEADIVVPLNPQDVAWLKVPSRAEVVSTLTGRPVRYPARLVRTEGRIDPRSRMLHAVIKVERPRHFTPPLENGDFVTARIQGKKAKGFWITAKAERDGKVWVAGGGKLKIRSVKVLYRKAERVLVSGLKEGDRVIITSLFAVTDGMKIRVRKTEVK